MAWPSALARTKDWGTEIMTDADLEGQLDLIITYINAMMDLTTGHKHDATGSEGPKILTANVNDAAGAQGDVYFSSGTVISRLAVGVSGQFLKTQGVAANPVWVNAPNADQSQDGSIVQIVHTGSTAVNTGSTTIPDDNTIPQNTEGDEYMTQAITAGSATNKFLVDVVVFAGHSAQAHTIAALFLDAVADAKAAVRIAHSTAGSGTLSFRYVMVAGDTSAHTFKVRAGSNGATTTFNGQGGTVRYGTAVKSSITITEIKAS